MYSARECSANIDSAPESLSRWVYTLNQIVLLDRDVPWIDGSHIANTDASKWPSTPLLGDCILLDFVRTAGAIFQNCVNAIKATQSAVLVGNSNDFGVSVNHSTAAVMRHAECAGEVMRVLNLVMKARRSALVSVEDESWTSVIGPIIQAAVDLLNSDLLSKVRIRLLKICYIYQYNFSSCFVIGCYYVCGIWSHLFAVDGERR